MTQANEGPYGTTQQCCEGYWYEYFTQDESGERLLIRVEQHNLWCLHSQSVLARGA